MKYKLIRNFLRIIPLSMICLLGGCSAVDVLNAVIPTGGYKTISDIAYGENSRQKLDIYVPDNLKNPAKTVIFIYGGSWRMGSKDQYLFAAEALASKGYIVVIPDYRIVPDSVFPAFLEDNARAVKWVHDNIKDYGGKPENLYLVGHSAGAYNAMMLALNDDYLKEAQARKSWIKGVAALSGPYDFLPMTGPDIIEVFKDEKDLHKTQPINYVGKSEPPMLLLTGEKDDIVSPNNTYHLAKKLQANGNWVTVKTYPNLGHIGMVTALAAPFRYRAPVLDDIAEFIDSH